MTDTCVQKVNELAEIIEKLEEFFAIDIPNPHHYPQSFMHYLVMYKDLVKK
jgi:hypothetical protein|tara:strand:+ start:4637 stop:4789 length:153 start_codon:yes stop_codon:yes gene_type:complete